MRLFIAVELPDPTKDQLEGLKIPIAGAVWTRRETYHITLRFLGDEIPESRVEPLRDALSAIEAPAFPVELRGVGRFPPNPSKPARVLWVGLAPNPPLMALYQAVETAVTALGFPSDDHPFSGHITLARLKSFKPDPAVDRFLKQYVAFSADPFMADHFTLFNSTLTPSGARYTRLAEFPLH